MNRVRLTRGDLVAGCVFVLFWLGWILAGRMNCFRDPGTFWHTVVGERILTLGFHDRDEYTFTRADATWLPHQWLGEVTFAGLYRWGGWDALLVAAAALLGLLLFALALRGWMVGLHPLLIAVLVGLLAASLSTHAHLRPHLFTMLGTWLVLATLVQAEAQHWPAQRAWFLLPLMLVWVNTHGGAVGGLCLVALALAGWGLGACLGQRTPLDRFPRALGWGCLGLALLALVPLTPYGLRIARTWVDIMQAPRLPEIIAEHAPFDPTHPANLPTLALMGLYLFGLVLVPWRQWRWTWLLPAFWLIQTWGRVRHGPLFALCACWVLVDLWPSTKLAAWLKQHRPDWHSPPRPGPLSHTGWIAVVALVAAGLGLVRVSPGPIAQFDPAYWPTEADATLREFAPPPGAPPARIFNDYIDGGYLIFHHPRYRVYVDDRCELFGDAWLVDFVAAGTDSARATEYLHQAEANYGRFDFALTRLGTGYDGAILAQPLMWETLSVGEVVRVSRRRPAPPQPTDR